MPPERKSKFDLLRDEAWATVAKWTESIATRPIPVALEQLALSRNVHRVHFLPLLSTAGLRKTEKGFAICVNTEAPGVEWPCQDLDLPGREWSNLKPALRFTLAHELAHVIFIELAGDNSRADLFRRHHQALEAACNQMARALLLPKRRLIHEVRPSLFVAEHVYSVARKFAVSPEVLVRRFEMDDLRTDIKDADGILALARRDDVDIELVASRAWGPMANRRWEKRDRLKLSQMLIPPDLVSQIETQPACQRKTDIQFGPKTVIPCEITTCRVSNQPLAIILGIHVLSPPVSPRTGDSEPKEESGLFE